MFLGALGTDMLTMEEYFPFVTKAFVILQYMAWCILFLITVWQLFRSFAGPILEAENPWHLTVRSALFAVMIGFAKPIFMLALEIARAPFTALMDASMDPGDFTFAGIEQTTKAGLSTIASVITIIPIILMLILLISLGWNYFKLMLEAVERYIVVGVLCYTSPLAFAMGGSKMTNQVFRNWCRMVGSQLLLLVMNVWFIRAFNSSVGHFVANGGALTSGAGNIFLWLFCALAFLKIAQKFDSHLSSIGLSVAQTGGSLGMEVLAASRALTGFGGAGGRSAGAVFGKAAGVATNAVSGTAAGLNGLTSMFKGNSYVRDAVVEGGSRMGVGGSLGLVGRALGSVAASKGASLTGESIASVASKPIQHSGAISGAIADRSLKNYMPHTNSMDVSNTEITGGRISTAVTGPDGKQAQVEMYNSSQFEKPDDSFSTVTASDGSTWYQMAAGDGVTGVFPTPELAGTVGEAEKVQSLFPDAEEGTLLRTVDDGVLEATGTDGTQSTWYSSALYEEPDAPHTSIQEGDGPSWYTMEPKAEMPEFHQNAEPNANQGFGELPGLIGGANKLTPTDMADGVGGIGLRNYGSTPGGQSIGGHGSTDEYDCSRFQTFMPSFKEPIAKVDMSQKDKGIMEVRHQDGAGTRFYDQTQFQTPRGDYNVFADKKGGNWYALSGKPGVDRVPVIQNGVAIKDEKGNIRTTSIQTIKYPTSLTRFAEPKRKNKLENRPPQKKK